MAALNDEQFNSFLTRSQLIECSLGDIIDDGTQKTNALCLMVSGLVRLVEQNPHGSEESTLALLKTCGSFWGNEFTQRTRLPAPLVRASQATKYLRLDQEALTEIIEQCPQFSVELDREAQIFRWFCRLRTSARFKTTEYSALRPALSQAELLHFSVGEAFSASEKYSEGLYVVLSGRIEINLNGRKDNLELGDWFCRGAIWAGRAPSAPGETAVEEGELIRLSNEAYANLRRLQPETTSIIDGLLFASETAASGSGATESVVSLDQSNKSKEIVREPLQESEIPKLRRVFHKYPHFHQQNELECGITCLQMICAFYGKSVPLSQLRELCEIGRSGVSLLALAESAEKLGFISRGIRATYEGLLTLKPPLICFWRRHHFVVLYEINPQNAIIGDPAEGLITLDRKKFTGEFSQEALELVPTTEFGRNLKSASMMGALMPIIRPHWRLARDVLVAGLVFQLLMLITPLFTQVILDQVIVHQDIRLLNVLLLGMVIVTIFQALMGFFRQYLMAFLAMKIDQSLFTELFKHLMSLPLNFFDQRSIGDILTRFAETTHVVQFFAGQGAVAMFEVCMASVYLFMIFFYNHVFGLAAFFYVFLIILLNVIYTPILRDLSRRGFDKQTAADAFLVETMRGIEKVKSAAAENRIRWKWELLFLDKLNIRFRELLTSGTGSALARLINLVGVVLFLWLGANMVVEQNLTIGQMVALNMLISLISLPFMRLIEISYAYQNVTTALERLDDIFEAEPEEPNPATKVQISEITGKLKFESVTFRYSGGETRNAVSNISFSTEPGQMIGVVGRSGSGKTTLMKLIQGLYLPVEGRILVDDINLSLISLSHYRQKMGVVSQNEYYFRGTVRENVAFYKPEAPMEEVIKACTIAGIHEFICTLPSAYETVLNEGASNLSGGQRQCLAIARALIHKPAILIFDEATSGMDTETERKIQDCMDLLSRQSTMFVVAHRLSTVKNADLILVMDQGQIVESGTHERLTAERGLYYYLCHQQVTV
jgi:ATP-binding cassette, subfamily B, bacterial HlyB/CyaB